MSAPAQRTCAYCGRTMTQRALYLQPSYVGEESRWLCRSLRACAASLVRQDARRAAAELAEAAPISGRLVEPAELA